MTRRPPLPALLLPSLLFFTLPAIAAHAHPFGQQPVAFIQPLERGVRISWVANEGEYRDLASRLRLGPVAVPAMAERASFRRYVLDNVRVSADGSRCEGSVEGVATVAGGFTLGTAFDCGAPIREAVVRLTLLQDVSERYVTLYRARLPAGTRTGAFTAGASTVRLDLTGRVEPSPVPEPAAADEGARARILAMLEGQAGAVSVGVALLFAFALGALHALTPGHGKTITAAYLVGSGGTTRQALALGGVVSATHAASVGVLGAIAIALGQEQPSGRVSAWLEVAAGILIVALGISLLRPARRREHAHEHGAAGMPLRRLAAIGVVGGLVPNPDAILIAFLAFQSGRWTVGAGLIVAFSLGLAVVVLGIAAAAVRGARAVRSLASGRAAALAPRVAAIVFLAMGIAVVLRGAADL